ncbi:hypothetical protein BH10ACI4_BH10ACI4_02550 [soil metagenome]
MKAILAILAAAVLSINATNLKADTFDLSLTTGATTDLLIKTPILGGFQYTYENLGVAVLPNGAFNLPKVNLIDNTFLATYVVTNGIGLLNITDVCANITVLGDAAPCQQFAFTFTNLSLGSISLLSVGGAATAYVDANVAHFDLAGASIGGGSASFQVNPPSAVPEPATLSMMATGLLGAAGAVRRKLKA